MKYNPISRRMFLQGTGHLLFTIPLLESLLPKALAQAQTAPLVRYIQLINQYSMSHSLYWGKVKTSNQVANNIVSGGHPIRAANLIDFASPLSRLIGPELSALRNKFTLIRGVDVQQPHDPALIAHNLMFPTCASPNKFKQDYHSPPLSNQESIDSLLARSSVIYPATFPATRRQIVLGAGTYGNSADFTFSWRKDADDVIRRIPGIRQTDALKSLFESGFTSEPQTISSGQVNVMNAVYNDYKTVRDSSKISSADRLKLEAYMSLIADIQRGFASAQTPTTACSDPAKGPETNNEDLALNQYRIVVAALACNLTRVASLSLVFDTVNSHGISHSMQPDDPLHANYAGSVALMDNVHRFTKRLAFLMTALEQIPDGSTNLLENSILYWTSEFGVSQGLGSGHERVDFPVFVAGGGGGNLQHGRFIDYRKPNGTDFCWRTKSDGSAGVEPLQGIPLNNLLVTFMNCMGLSSQHYEINAGKGFGYYSDAVPGVRVPDANFWYSTQGRRSPVPLLYKGSLLG